MTPGLRKKLEERMAQASLDELMPGFDKEMEWNALNSRLHGRKTMKLQVWRYAAAILLLVGVGCGAAWWMNGNNSSLAGDPVATEHNWMADMIPAQEEPIEEPVAQVADGQATTLPDTEIRRPVTKKILAAMETKAPGHKGEKFVNYYHTNDFVCNGTPCPLEICIVQTIKCPNKKPAAVATCSTLQPDQSSQLKFKAPGSGNDNCKMTINEIRIRRVTTGETIVLNAHSRPTTAEDLFNCITGQDKCDILAGMFHSDCNNDMNHHSLKIDDNYGDIIFQ